MRHQRIGGRLFRIQTVAINRATHRNAILYVNLQALNLFYIIYQYFNIKCTVKSFYHTKRTV